MSPNLLARVAGLLPLRITRAVYQAGYRRWLRSRYTPGPRSILCNSCAAGVIYNLLGERFLSPTINLWIKPPDFYRMVSDLPHYLAQELEFFRSDAPYPVARLGGDVVIDFNHYHSEAEAREKWEERKRRIDPDHLYILTSDGSGVTYDDLVRLGRVPCRKLAIFTARPYPELPYCVPLRAFAGRDSAVQHMLIKSVWTGRFSFEDDFDYVRWLGE